MNPIQHLRIDTLMSFVDGIIYFYGRKQIIIIESISDMIDMEMYSFFKEHYNIHIFEKRGIVFDIKVVSESGDVAQFYNGKLFIPKGTNNINVVYSLNGIQFQQSFNLLENDYIYQEEVAHICFNQDPKYLTQMVMGKTVEEIQKHIYQNMKYNPAVKPILQYNTSVINCLHIGLEDELLHKIAATNQMPFEQVKAVFEQRYINAIRDNFEKYDNIMVFKYNKTIVDFLERDNYVYELFDSDTIVDIVRSKFCNHIFIGKEHSTLSFYIGINITNKILL